MTQLTLGASAVVRRLGERARNQLFSNGSDRSAHFRPQAWSERDLLPATRASVPDEPERDLDFEHLFEAEGLGAQLQIGCRPVPDAGLVLHRTNSAIVLDLDHIGSTRQAERLRPQRDSTQDLPTSLLAMAPAVHPAMGSLTLNRMLIVAPHAVAVDEGALPLAVDEMLDRRYPYDGLRAHRRREP